MLLDDSGVGEKLGKIESLLDDIESFEDSEAREKTSGIVQSLLEIYGEGLARIMEAATRNGDTALVEDIADDSLVSHLLILHGLHPKSVEERVTDALEEVRPYLQSHGGNVEFLGVEDGIARLRLEGSCNGCPSSTMTLKLAIEEAIKKAAPDLDGMDAEGVAEPEPSPTFVATPTRKKKKEPEAGEASETSWMTVGSLPQLAGGGTFVKEVSGASVLFMRPEDTFFAYGSLCPNCAESLEKGVLTGAELRCEGCGFAYDVRRAGRCLDSPSVHLEPVPLLVDEDGIVKVALPSVAVG